MNKLKAKQAKDRTHNFIVGGGVMLFVAALIGYGLWTGPADAIGSSSKTTEKEAVMEITITKTNFEAEVLKSDKPVLVDFWAPWCGPCRMVLPIVEQIATERDDIVVAKVNVDEEQELAAKYGVMTIPTLMVVKNGEITNRSVGAKPKSEILKML